MSTFLNSEHIEKVLNSPWESCKELKGIKVDGHKGTWYSIKKHSLIENGNVEIYYIMEHETYGEDAHHIMLDSNLMLVAEDLD